MNDAFEADCEAARERDGVHTPPMADCKNCGVPPIRGVDKPGQPCRYCQNVPRYKYAVVAVEDRHTQSGLRLCQRLIIHTNNEARAHAVLSALNAGRVYMANPVDGDVEYFLEDYTQINGRSRKAILEHIA